MASAAAQETAVSNEVVHLAGDVEGRRGEESRSDPGATPARRLFTWAMIAAVFALTATVRLWQLGEIPFGFNHDEAQKVYEGQLLLKTGTYSPAISQARESTVPYLLGFILDRYGHSPFLFRLPAAIMGGITIVSVLLIARGVFPLWYATLMAAVVSTYFPLLFFNRTAHRVSYWIAVSFLSFAAFRWAEDSRSAARWFVFGLAVGLGFHTYHAYRFAPVFWALVWIHRLAVRRGFRERLAETAWTMLGAALGAFNVVFALFKDGGVSYFGREQSVWVDTLSALPWNRWMANARLWTASFVGEPIHLLGENSRVFSFWALPLLLCGAWVCVRRWRSSFHFAALAFMVVFFVPGILTEVLTRRMLLAYVWAVVTAGIGLWEMRGILERAHRAAFPVLSGAVALVFCSLSVHAYFGPFAADVARQGAFFPEHRRAVDQLARVLRPDSIVVLSDRMTDNYLIQIGVFEITRELGPGGRKLRLLQDGVPDVIAAECRQSDVVYVHDRSRPDMDMQTLASLCPGMRDLSPPDEPFRVMAVR